MHISQHIHLNTPTNPADNHRLRITVADNLAHSGGLAGIIDLLNDLVVAFATTDQFSEKATAVLIELIRDRLRDIHNQLADACGEERVP